MREIQPEVVTQGIRMRVSQLFGHLKGILDEVEMEVMNGIKSSENLKLFLESIEGIQAQINEDVLDLVEEENGLVSEKIS